MDHVDVARRFVSRAYPEAASAILGGSVADSTATATSDLDFPADSSVNAAYVKTLSFDGWLVEAFVYGPSGWREWVQKGRDDRRPVLDSIAAAESRS